MPYAWAQIYQLMVSTLHCFTRHWALNAHVRRDKHEFSYCQQGFGQLGGKSDGMN